MNIEINTVTKTIVVLDKTNITELINLLKTLDWEDFTIISKNKVEWVTPQPFQPASPFSPPYIITY